jgi:hypothetical protein
MPASPKPYTRLTRSAAGVASYSSLWLGSDHLLIVTSTGYSERYARVLLRDVRALFVAPTDRRLYWGIVWGAIVALGALVVGVRLQNGQTPTFSVAFFLLGVIGSAINALLGPGCRVHLVTGVQTIVLPALVRAPRAHRVIARLQPLILATQSDLAPAAPST